MSSDIVLGTATRQNLLALQGINQNLDTTQGHLATGLKVASALDDAVKFFQAQSLSDRANDLAVRKDAIDQGVSSLTTAVNAAQSEVSILQQLQGILSSAKTQTAAQRKAASTQFNTLSNQLNQLLNDASYQGLNLVNSTATALSLQFSNSSKSTLKVSGQNLLISNVVTTKTVASKLATKLVGSAWSKVISANHTSKFDIAFNAIQNAIATVQAAAASIGGNVTFLQSRLDFTSQYIVTLQGGASKLTVADVNEESTNLVTLQTRQSLSIQSLSIATQSEQAVLRLFR